MGNCVSNDVDELERLRQELDDTKLKSGEQQNLLRFKIEVLVNMLAMEEKKSESIEKRVDTLKWLLHSQGIAEQTLTSILLNAEKTDDETRAGMMGSLERSISFRNVGLVDLAGALSRTQEEFSLYRADILPAFAGEDGKIVANLSNDEFMKQLYTVTEKLSKADIQIIALRFGDGSGFVSIPEFLEFFTTPSHVRLAKAATSAVRMSLGLLTMEADENYLQQEGYESEEELGEEVNDETELKAKGFLMPQVLSSHLTQNLDRGVRRLLAMWVYVKFDLENSFVLLESPTIAEQPEEGSIDQHSKRGEQLISLADFKRVLLEKGGIKSGILGNADRQGKITFNQTGKIIPATPMRSSMDGSGGLPMSPGRASTSESPRTFNAPRVPGAPVTGVSGKDGGKSDPKAPLSKAVSSSAAFSTKSKGLSESKKEENDSSNAPALPVIEPLNAVDVDLLAERFELGGYVHYGHFLAYFSELHSALSLTTRKHLHLPAPAAAATASPFLVSSEWENLRASALLRQYSHTPPPAPVAESKTPTPEPPSTAETKAPLPPDNSSKKLPDQAPPKGVAVVGPSSGFLCCGVGGVPKPNPNAPEPLPPIADAKTAWVDPNEDKNSAPQIAEEKQDKVGFESSDSEESTGPTPDPGFRTPVERSMQNKKLSFQPRRVTRDASEDEADMERSGLGKKDRLEIAVPEKHASRRNHFTRRESGDPAGSGELGNSGAFSAPRGGETRWK